MRKWQKAMKSHFRKNYSECMGLPVLSFMPLGKAESKILFIGSEHGNMPFCAEAMLDKAKEIADGRLYRTQIDMIPVIDKAGHPVKSTLMGLEGFDSPSYLKDSVLSQEIPEIVSGLLSMLSDSSYSLVVQATSLFKEDFPFINGYFAVPQVKAEHLENGGTRLIVKPATNDIMGTLVHAVQRADYSLQTMHNQGRVGDRHIILSEGVLAPVTNYEGQSIIGTRNLVQLACEKKGIESVLLVSAAGKYEGNAEARDSHKAAIESIIRLYEKIR